MKVPTLEGPRGQIRPAESKLPSADARGAFGDDVAKGLERLGDGVLHAGVAIEQAKEEARSTALYGWLTEYQRRETDIMVGNSEDPQAPPGFTSRLGEDAAKYSADALERLEKRRQEIAGRISDTKTRDAFLAKSGGLYADTERQVELHVAKQRSEARTKNGKGAVEMALTKMIAHHDDEGVFQTQMDYAEGAIRNLLSSSADSPEADANVQAFRQLAVAKRLDKYLDTEDWVGAKNLYEREGPMLGEKLSSKYGKDVRELQIKKEANEFADYAVQDARDEDSGRVDEGRVLASIEKAPEYLQDALRKVIPFRLGLAKTEWERTVDHVFDKALTAYELRHNLDDIDQRTWDWLGAHSPADKHKLEKMDVDYKAMQRQAATAKARTPDTPAQVDALIALKADMQRRPDFYKDMDQAAFKRMWRPRLSQSGYIEGAERWVKTQGDDPAALAEFTNFVNNQVTLTEGLKGKVAEANYRAKMGDLRHDFILREKRAPSVSDFEAINAEAFKRGIVEGWFRQLFGLGGTPGPAAYELKKPEPTEAPRPPAPPAPAGPEVQEPAAGDLNLDEEPEPEGPPPGQRSPPKPPPPPKKGKKPGKKITKYLVSPDKKQRVPVYEDGTKGPVEQVR